MVIIAGDGDKVVFKRRSEQLRASIPGSVLQIVKGAGHMVHHLAARQVARAVENVATVASAQTPAVAQPEGPGWLQEIMPDAA